MVFVHESHEGTSSEVAVESTKFYQFRHAKYIRNKQEISVLQIYDVSSTIRFEKLRRE